MSNDNSKSNDKHWKDWFATTSDDNTGLGQEETLPLNDTPAAATKQQPHHKRGSSWTVELDLKDDKDENNKTSSDTTTTTPNKETSRLWDDVTSGAAYSSIGVGSRQTLVQGNDYVPTQPQFQLLLRHDSDFSVGSDYNGTMNTALREQLMGEEAAEPTQGEAAPLLNTWQGALLLTADCLGTGLLALPGDVQVLGLGLGLGFLILNAPINWCAGYILSDSAATVEKRQAAANRIFATAVAQHEKDQQSGSYGSTAQQPHTDTAKSLTSVITVEENATGHHHAQLHHDTATFDFIGMTQALWKSKRATQFVMSLYYLNIFLVLGNYILVMSHAVQATLEGTWMQIDCTPVAGLLASVTMYGVSQSRTMARLGRLASILSLMALAVVIVQCLYAAQTTTTKTWDDNNNGNEPQTADSEDGKSQTEESGGGGIPWTTIHNIFHKLSALGSIGFAMGSQKLFLNIRHELQDRQQAPVTLGISLTIFTAVYTTIILMAGPNPPNFLFDAIPAGHNRNVAGALLWGHVVVSYAINSQAICSSMDRLVWHRLTWMPGHRSATVRWMTLTAVMAVTSYTVANAIPFFQDLVGLIGAMTAVPLTLLLPALFWRKLWQWPLWTMSSWDSFPSWALVAFSVVFMVTATVGVLDTILQDWKHHGGRPFACSK